MKGGVLHSPWYTIWVFQCNVFSSHLATWNLKLLMSFIDFKFYTEGIWEYFLSSHQVILRTWPSIGCLSSFIRNLIHVKMDILHCTILFGGLMICEKNTILLHNKGDDSILANIYTNLPSDQKCTQRQGLPVHSIGVEMSSDFTEAFDGGSSYFIMLRVFGILY